MLRRFANMRWPKLTIKVRRDDLHITEIKIDGL